MKAVAPGKLILSGEHAVVYGQPAIAMAIDRCAVAVLTPAGGGEVAFDLADLRASESFTLRALRDLKTRVRRNYEDFQRGELGVREILRKPIELFQYGFINLLDGLHLKLPDGLNIRLSSTIPIGCGLGSSAATVLSLLRAIGHYLRVEFRPDWYYRYSLDAENLQHGHASGVDSWISLHGGCAVFQRGAAERLPLPRLPLHLVQTGAPAVTTGECVEAVRRAWGASNIWTEFGAVTREMEAALRAGDAARVCELVRANHRLLTRIGVVPEPVQSFVRDIEAAGHAAKVCGAGAIAGAGGGTVLVISPQPPEELCRRYGYTLLSVRGEPLGARVV